MDLAERTLALCAIHSPVGEEAEIAGIPVRTTPLVSPNHLYIGREEASERDVLKPVAA